MPAERRTPVPNAALPKFWTAKICPFAQMVAIALKEKDVEHEHIEIDLQNKSEEFLRVNPGGKVPVLEDVNHTLLESSVLVEYVDETWDNPGHSLMPQDTAARARIRVFCNLVNDLAIGPFYKCLSCPDEKEREELFKKLLDNYKKLLTSFDKEGPYIMGKEFTMADVKLGPFKKRFFLLERFYNLKTPDDKEFQRLEKWWDTVRERPSFVTTTPSDDYFVEKYGKYAKKL